MSRDRCRTETLAAQFTRHRLLAGLILGLLTLQGAALAGELEPARVEQPLGASGVTLGWFAARTLTLGIEVDRDQARVIAYTEKARAFVRPLAQPVASPYQDGRSVQLEVVLLGPDGVRYTQRKEIGKLCFVHGPEAEPHVAGDTIRLHRDSFLIEVPALENWDRIEVAYYESGRTPLQRRTLGIETLEARDFRASPGDTAIGLAPGLPDLPPPTPGAATALWPEDFGDPDVYRVYGNEAEAHERVNIVIVPDGYTYAEKTLMESHAQAMVDWFRSVSPYKEHDAFINYTLVYAYSVQSGADQCDCDIVLDTAMGTRFLESNPNCGSSANRCLYYGGGCDTNGTTNIVAAELRAPAQDETIVMVNTTRYGGCGGARSVYSAANSSATDIAVHELGHSWAGLADEYAYNAGCGGNAGEVNTSLDAVNGAWSEWIDDLGAPREGAQYWQECIFRPLESCEMRSLFQPFCPVCKQHWSLVTFGHWRISPTAPIRAMTPAASTTAWVGVPLDFEVLTRLSSGAQVTNQIRWTHTAPGLAIPTIVNSDTTLHTQIFTEEGLHQLEVQVVADTNFVKSSRWGANQDEVTWQIDVSILLAPEEISAPGAAEPLVFSDPSTLIWEDGTDARAFTYNLYRGELSDLNGSGYGVCLQAGLEQNSYQDEIADPAVGQAWFYLVSGANPAGEGPLGERSSGLPRSNVAPCGTN